MNTIAKDTLSQLAKVHELRRIELEAEGWTAKLNSALGSERMALLCFKNGCEHSLVLPLARLFKWGKLCEGDLSVEFPESQSITMRDGSGTLTLFNQLGSPEAACVPRFEFEAHDYNGSEFKLCGQADTLDKLKAAKSVAKEQKRLAVIARKRGAERQALKRLQDAAHEHCERLAFMASMTLEQAVTEARAFRQARRFVRRTLAQLEVKPDWLLRFCPTKDSAEWIHKYQPEITESQEYDTRLAEYLEAKRKLESYKPRTSWSCHAQRETEKRQEQVNRTKSSLQMALQSALRRHLGGHPDGWGEQKRVVSDAAYSFTKRSPYRETRQFVRGWPQDKLRLAVDYTMARQERIDAQ